MRRITSKYWSTIIYEESVNKYWKEILKDTNLPIAISPIHDKDKYSEYDYDKYIKENGKEPSWKAGEIKKPHRHILIEYANTTTQNCIKEQVTDKINGVGTMPVGNKKGYYEYLWHKNEIDKYIYKEEDVIRINGFEIKEEDISNQKREEIKKAIINLINIYNFVEYYEVYDYLIKNELNDHAQIYSKNTIFFATYLRSKRFTLGHLRNLDKEKKVT